MTNNKTIVLAGYQFLSHISKSVNSLVYRGIREQDNKAVILKVLKQDYPTPQEMTRNLNTDGVVKAHSLEPLQRTLVIILEDFGGSSLKRLMNERMGGGAKALPLQEFLSIAIQTAQILGTIHSSNVIHKDINPSNILLNPETGIVKIIDFGIATQLTRENPTLKNPNVLEGTLAYMSPEQTGRMNRDLDYRTDFYSLGVTFYELLTGKLPFATTDALELVHCHIAKQPLSPHQLIPEIPNAVSEIVMKLMAKTAEERYQSAFGIRADLEECLNQLQRYGEISDFPLATQDISDKFHIPQKLYGREAEVETLLAAFERVATGGIGRWGKKNTQSSIPNPQSPVPNPKSKIRPPRTPGGQGGVEMMLVAGYSGIGKSALVAEIYKPITRQRGYFISGKFDQFQRNIPYSAVVTAFKSLVQQLLTEGDAQLKQWKEKLLAAFGSNGQIIIDVIPEVELIVGQQPPVEELGPAQSQNRFNRVFQRFIRVFCSKEHPLVIFLDDLQWADSATLKLIELMMTDEEMQYLFLIGAYRDNEVYPTHPLMITLDGLRQVGTIINQITLYPLSLEHITRLIADTLHRDFEAVKPLAELVIRKTSGNPFFVNQFLKTLYSENLLTFHLPQSGSRGQWQWDISNIEAMDITDNVVELMVGKLKKLPQETQQALRLAACVGNQFALSTLAIVHEKSGADTFRDLLTSIQEGLLLPTSELEITDEDILISQLLILNFKFLHDRVQQAAEGLIDEAQKKAVHLQIGRLLMANLNPEEQEDRIFELVDHLNLGRELMRDDQEKVELAALNLEAGKKAKDATAYAAAKQYLTVGLEVLPGNVWEDYYDLAFALHHQRADVEYLNGNFEESEALINLTLAKTKSDLEKAEIYNLLIVQYTLRTKYQEAVQTGRKALAMLGIGLPESDLKRVRDIELAESQKNLGNKEIASLLDEPEMSLPTEKAAAKLLITMAPLTYLSNPDLWSVIVLKTVNLGLKYGSVPYLGYGYSAYGYLLASLLGDYQAGYEFGRLSLKVSEKFNNMPQKCRACLIVIEDVNHWVKHLKCAETIEKEGYQIGLESGEIQYVSYMSVYQSFHSFYKSENLNTTLAKVSNFLEFSQKSKNQWATDSLLGIKLILFNLNRLTSGKLIFASDEVDEVQYLGKCHSHKTLAGICNYNIFKSQVLYLYGEPAEALWCASSAEKLLSFIYGQFGIAEHNFYTSLTLAALYPEVSESEQKRYWKRLEANQKQMKIWADNCPENFLHKYLLVAAEMARISGKELEAMDLYDRAISSALENEFIQNEALANELAAKFWLGKGKEEFAQLYMKKAHYGYQLWGAKRKVEDLEEKYPQLVPLSSAARSITDTPGATTTITSTGTSVALDLATVMKASQAISGEIVLDKLLASLMRILIENAGAQCGYLILETEGKLRIEASGSVNSDNITVLQSIPIESGHKVSSTIVNYVVRTSESVVLNDATHEGSFTNDSYIKEHQPKSILCVPLINQGKLTSIVYLENNLTTGAFTPERLEVIKVLSSSAAISIENARLYNNLAESNRTLETKVEERTTELAIAKQKAEVANEAKSTCLANMSHELRTPLNAILGFTQLTIKNPSLSPDSRENLGIITRSGEHLLTLINQVLDLSKIEAGRTTLNEKNFDLYRLLDDLEDMFQLKADDKHLELLIDRTPDVPRYVRTDEGKLLQVLINLLNNALKFTTEGGVSVRVDRTLNVERLLAQGDVANVEGSEDSSNLQLANLQPSTQTNLQSSTLTFEVEDTGPGIAPDELDSLFEAFVQTTTGTEAQEGTGLGLPISRKFVQLMGGEIMVSSEVAHGTLFKFDITVSVVDATDLESKQPTRRVIALEPNQPRYRILIVDDKPLNRQLLVKLLNPFGFELREASNGKQAVEIWDEWEPHLIWMDMRMPVMDGYEATKQIKSTTKGQATAVIALTASVLEEERAVVLSTGCDDFLRKPFREEEIFAAMHKHIGVRYLYEEPTDSTQSNTDIQNVLTKE